MASNLTPKPPEMVIMTMHHNHAHIRITVDNDNTHGTSATGSKVINDKVIVNDQ